MRVKEVKTGEVKDVPESLIKAWPGHYVPAKGTEKPSGRAASTVSATAGTKNERKSK